MRFLIGMIDQRVPTIIPAIPSASRFIMNMGAVYYAISTVEHHVDQNGLLWSAIEGHIYTPIAIHYYLDRTLL